MRFHVVLISLLFGGLAQAADLPPLATGAQLRSAVSGNTIEGSMVPSGRYTEFYANDGTVKGKDYRATWRIEGDTMCWLYPGQPKDCWRASIAGKSVKWIKDGKVLGTGTIVKGNVRNF